MSFISYMNYASQPVVFDCRGVKATQWEGGVRGTGFLWSPLLKQTGYVSNHMLHVCDWLPTLYAAAGGNPGAIKGLDGQSEWEALTNNKPGARQEILHNIDPKGKGQSGLRVGDYKIVVGDIGMAWSDWYPPWTSPADSSLLHVNQSTVYKLYGMDSNTVDTKSGITDSLNKNVEYFSSLMGDNMGYEGDFTNEENAELKFNSFKKELSSLNIDKSLGSKELPKSTLQSYYHKGKPVQVECGPKPFNASTSCDPRVAPCLFNIAEDPCEYNNIAGAHSDIVIQLMMRLQDYENGMVPPLNTPVDPAGNPKYHGGAWVPWVKL